MDANTLFDLYSATEVTVYSGTLRPNEATWLDQETYPSLEVASEAARTDPRHAGKVVQMILHLRGEAHRPLTREEIAEVLRPRPEYGAAVKTGMRLARDLIEPLEEKLSEIIGSANGRGQLGSRAQHYQPMTKACVSTLREAGRIIIRTLITKKGHNAKNRRDNLAAALEEFSGLLIRQFDSHDGSPLLPKPVRERAELEAEMARTTGRILLDFDEGVYQMGDDQKRGGDINIGQIGTMAGHIGTGNSGDVRAEQSMNEREIFMDLIAATRSVQSAEERDTILAAIASMEAQRGEPASFARAYGFFLSTVADHMQVFGPFVPAVAALLAKAVS